MSDSREHRVDLQFVGNYEFVVAFKDGEGLQPMVLDEPPPLGEGTGPSAAAMLAAAVGNCLAASLVFCLRKVRLEPEGLTATAMAQVSRNEHGRFRVSGIEVTLVPKLRESDPTRLGRCERLFEDFCIVTESVRRGIPVSVRVESAATRDRLAPVRQQSDTRDRPAGP